MCDAMVYAEENMVRVARRENNSKRGYLIVNALQGKHVPVSPAVALRMFGALAERVRADMAGQRVLVVGFAETATAIGATMAVALGCHYLQTTRESARGRACLYVTEAHSHATQQTLDKADIAAIWPTLDCVVFAEDELTTGNTMLGLVDVLEREFEHRPRLAAACLLNSMAQDALCTFASRGIALYTLLAIDHSGYPARALSTPNDGAYHRIAPAGGCHADASARYPGRLDARRMVNGTAYQAACEALWQCVRREDPVARGMRVLVLGTEECMYPGLYLASQMERLGANVRFHATTRSPIEVSTRECDPLHARYALRSLYDGGRATFVYELAAYDRVFVVTDAPARHTAGLRTLLAALRHAGNRDIRVVRWCEG